MGKDKQSLDDRIRQALDRHDDPKFEPSAQDPELPEFDDLLSDAFESKPLHQGMQIGHWTVCEPIGQGGMSQVYRVERTDGQLKQQLALKIVPDRLHSEAIKTRFLRERQILSDLNHHHIAQFFDAGMTGSGQPWFVMEYIQGPNLLRHCEQEDLPLQARIRLIRQLCEALAHAHSHQIVHRDIKPGNVLIHAETGTVKLLDFGVATDLEDQSLTLSGTVIGTPGYMSPEQAAGRSLELDARSDLFSVGVMLYQLLASRLPFEGENYTEVSHRIIHDEPKPLPRSVPRDLAAIVFQCLQKNPDHRYRSVNRLIDDLDAFLQNRPVSARRITPMNRLLRLIKRNRALSSAIGLALLALLFAGGFAAWQSVQTLRGIAASEQLSYQSQKLVNEVRRIHMMPTRDTRDDYARIRAELDDLAEAIDQSPDINVGQAHAAIASVHGALGEFEQSLSRLALARDAGWQTPQSTFDEGLARLSLWQIEKRRIDQLRDEAQRERDQQALDERHLQPGLDALEAARGQVPLADFLEAKLALFRGDYDDAIDYAQQSLARNDWHHESHLLISGALMQRLTDEGTREGYEHFADDIQVSMHHNQMAMSIARSDPLVFVQVCGDYSAQMQHFRNTDRHDDAKSIVTDAMAACQTAIELSPASPSVHTNLSEILVAHGDTLGPLQDEAYSFYEQALGVIENGLAQNPDSIRILRHHIKPLIRMAVYRRESEKPGVSDLYLRAMSFAERVTEAEPNHAGNWRELSRVQVSMANYLRDQQANAAEAIPIYQSSIANYQRTHELSGSLAAQLNAGLTRTELAHAREQLGEYEPALNDYLAGLAELQNLLKLHPAHLPVWKMALNNARRGFEMTLKTDLDSTSIAAVYVAISETICSLINGPDQQFTESLTHGPLFEDGLQWKPGECVERYLSNLDDA